MLIGIKNGGVVIVSVECVDCKIDEGVNDE